MADSCIVEVKAVLTGKNNILDAAVTIVDKDGETILYPSLVELKTIKFTKVSSP